MVVTPVIFVAGLIGAPAFLCGLGALVHEITK